ncbi:MAG: NfeD family protein [Oscillospiraceae bacterium]
MGAMFWFWAVACLVLLILEAATAMLVSIWFVGGAAAALIVCLCGGALWLQIVLFFVVSVALLLLLRPLLRRQCNPDKLKTNVDALIGKQAIVIEKIDNLEGRGRIQVDSADWTARSDDGSVKINGVVWTAISENVRAYVAPVHARPRGLRGGE